MGAVGPALVTRRPSGNYLIAARKSLDVSARHGATVDWRLMGPEGEDVTYQEGDL
ncbi:hypothetical protein [Streptomyces lutosisoli]|uniref:Uncharacterized protein n=1 Tax=Streptomyces lutosisoli TaxID=2665721 RepID=A0ABW2VCF0_9ACTN